LKKTEKLKK